jgi:hypothetical protein
MNIILWFFGGVMAGGMLLAFLLQWTDEDLRD